MVAGFGVILYLGTLPTIIFVLLIQLRMFHEITAVSNSQKRASQVLLFRILPDYLLLITSVSLTLMNLRPQLVASWPEAIHFYEHFHFLTFVTYLIGFLMFVVSLRKGLIRSQFEHLTWVTVTLLFINVQSSLVVPNMLQGMFWFILPCSCVVVNDIFAYVCGKLFGRTRLSHLSPNKTLEGFAGACLFTIAWAWFFSDFLSQFPSLVCETKDFSSPVYSDIPLTFLPQEIIIEHRMLQFFAKLFLGCGGGESVFTFRPVQLHALSLAAFASLIAPAAGFFASGFKRAFKLKDFSDLIPGHGGMTDRMDCQLLMGAFTYFYYVKYVRSRRMVCNFERLTKLCLSSGNQ